MQKIKDLLRKAYDSYLSLSNREKGIIFIALTIFLLMAVYQVIEVTREKFLSQTIRFEEADASIRSLAPLIVKYSRSKAKRDQIEAKYKAVKISEGGMSMLERLAKDRAKPMPGSFTIVPRSAPFGSQYKQTTYAIKFRTNQVQDLVNFLNEVVDGARPLLLTRVDITRSYAGDRLDVEVDISSIEKKSPKDEI